jgi:Antitoxin SocA-like, Panacea domain
VAGGTEFNRTKFKELILHLADQSKDDPGFAMTKLNKLLFFCDFEAFRRLGRSITGAEYQKLEWGPAAKQFLPLHEELLKDHWAHIERRRRGDYEQKVTVSTGADTSVFDDDELAVVADVVARLRPFDATGSSELSHRESPGWNAAEFFEVIPYETARISTERPPESAFNYFRKLHGLGAQ